MVAESALLNRKIPPERQSRVYPGIDLIKFFCAFLVFMIHFTPFRNDAFPLAEKLNFYLQKGFCRIAVPFYFTASGFFLFRKTSLKYPDRDRIRRYCFKLLRLMGLWSVLLFYGSTYHLWYLGASVVAITLLSLCLRFRFRLRYICLLAVLLYGIGLLGSLYCGLVLQVAADTPLELLLKIYFRLFDNTRNGVFMGFLFVLMGALFARFGTKMNPWAALLGFVVSVTGMLAEVSFAERNGFPHMYDLSAFLVPAEFFLFSFACNLRLQDRPVYPKLRTAGLLIYLSHMIVYAFTGLGLVAINRLFGINLISHKFIITLIVTVTFAFLLEWLSRRKAFYWIRWLIS